MAISHTLCSPTDSSEFSILLGELLLFESDPPACSLLVGIPTLCFSPNVCPFLFYSLMLRGLFRLGTFSSANSWSWGSESLSLLLSAALTPGHG